MNQKRLTQVSEVDFPRPRSVKGLVEDVVPVRPPQMRLDEAASTLMEFLPQETQERIREAAEGMRVPLWQMFLGYVMRCRDREEVWSPHLLSMWEEGLPASAPRKCKTCGLMFVSKFPEAQFCCNPCACEKLHVFGHTNECPTKQHEQTMAGVAA